MSNKFKLELNRYKIIKARDYIDDELDQTIIKALKLAEAIQNDIKAGWAMIPTKLTEEMIKAAFNSLSEWTLKETIKASAMYQTIIKARPQSHLDKIKDLIKE